MKNNELERQVDRAKRDFDNFEATANDIVNELVFEIESLEDQISDKNDEIGKLENKIEELEGVITELNESRN